jgi:hypothetical protein
MRDKKHVTFATLRDITALRNSEPQMSADLCETNLELTSQVVTRALYETRQCVAFFGGVASPVREFAQAPAGNIDRLTPAHARSGVGAIGVPGTLADAVGQFIETLPFIVDAIWQLLLAFDQARAEAASIERQLQQTAGELLRDAGNAVCTLKNLGELLGALAPKYVERSVRFSDMTSNQIENPGQSTQTVQRRFGELSKMRRQVSKSAAQLRGSGQLAITAYREKLAAIAQLLRGRNRTLRSAMLSIALVFSRVAERMDEANGAIPLTGEKIDFKADFRRFVAASKIARFDLSDVPFVPYPTNTLAFSGASVRVEVPPPQIYPIGMAKVICDYYAAGANELSCKAGKRMLLMEEMDDDWVFVMSPATFVSGFVPRLCLSPIGHGLAVMLREQAGALPGDCVAVIQQGKHGACTVETAFGHQLTVSKGNLGIIYS